MLTLFEHASMAWNPITQARRRLSAGTLSVGQLLGPYLAIAVACQLAAASAQVFALEQLGVQLNIPFWKNEYFTKLVTVFGLLMPIGAVAALPARIFWPHGRSTTLGAILILTAAWAFYGAAFSIPLSTVAGIVGHFDGAAGMQLFLLFSLVSAIATVAVMLMFWFVMTRRVLKLSVGSIVSIAAVLVAVTGLLLLLVVEWIELAGARGP